MKAEVASTASLPTAALAPSAGGKIGAPARAFWRQSAHLVVFAAMATASYLLISHFFLASVQVVGMSMAPTLHDSEHYLLNRWIYYVRGPKRADVVVLRDPVDHSFAVKRIIATAGDTVYLKDGAIYLNGQPMREPYLQPGIPTFPYAQLKEQYFQCGKDQFFVLGDNRMNSADSRTYGLISRRNILGLVIR
ncbi:Signal peptidase I (fragment) [Verrucomicrobia bacterium]